MSDKKVPLRETATTKLEALRKKGGGQVSENPDWTPQQWAGAFKTDANVENCHQDDAHCENWDCTDMRKLLARIAELEGQKGDQ